jgi:hypothetical protein
MEPVAHDKQVLGASGFSFAAYFISNIAQINEVLQFFILCLGIISAGLGILLAWRRLHK